MSTYDLKERMRQALQDIGENLVVDIRDGIVKYNINASGELYKSIEYTINGNSVEILSNDYITYAQFGRKKGKVPYNFANIIADWAVKKGVVPAGMTPIEFGWATSTKIKKYGSAKHRGSIPQTDLLEKPIQEALARLYPDLQTILVDSVNGIL